MDKLPKARTTGIALQYFGGELVVKDLKANKTYHLNKTGSIIYQACDGKTAATEMTFRFHIPAKTVFKALNELDNFNLIENNATSADFVLEGKKIKRREAFRLFGFTGLFAFLGSVLSSCGGGNDISMPVPSVPALPVATPNPFDPPSTPGDAGYVPVAYTTPKITGSDTPENRAACQTAALTACKSGKAQLVCTPPGNNYCACTCL